MGSSGASPTSTGVIGGVDMVTQAELAATSVALGSQLISVKDPAYGAKGDRRAVADGAITTGTAVLTSATGSFTAADVGKFVSVAGAGVAAAVLTTTILSYQSATQVTLTVNASTTVTGATVKWATDDTAAIQAAITAAGAAGGGIVLIPAGRYLVTGLTMSANGVTLQGAGIGDTASGGYGSMLIGAASMGASTDLVSVTGIKCAIRGLTLSGDTYGRDVIRLSNAAQRFIGEDLYIQFGGGCGITHGTSVASLTCKWSNIYIANNASHGIVVNSSDTEWVNVTTFSNGGDGLRAVGSSGNVTNLHSWGNTGIGVNFQGATGWRITNVYSETNTSDGINFGATSIYHSIVNGHIRANGANGVNIQGSSKRNTLVGLQIYNNTGRGVWVQSGDYCTIDGCHFFDDQGSKTQTYGIDITAGVVSTSILGRLPYAVDHVTGGLADAGTATVANGTITLRKAADQSVSNNTLVNDADIALAVGAGEVWEFEGVLFVEGSTAGDFAIRLNTPSVGSGYWHALGPAASVASSTAASYVPAGQAFNVSEAVGMNGAGVVFPIAVRGLLTVGVTGGTFNLKWAQQTTDATATIVHAGSYLKCRRLA